MAAGASPGSPLWAVWTVWRGDRAKLSRIARAIEASFTAGEFVRTRVEVDVLGDHETYRRSAAFTRDAPVQTTAEFETLTFVASGAEGRVAVRVARRVDPGVTLTVEAAPGAPARWAEYARTTIVPAVSRGAIQWQWATRWPLKWLARYTPQQGSGPGAATALARATKSRKRAMWAWTSLIAVVMLAIGYAVGRPAWDAGWTEVGLVAAGVLLLGALVGLIGPVRDAVLPPVEIAEQTPGRRQAARLSLIAAPIVAAVARQVF